jgi:hypothetical protein
LSEFEPFAYKANFCSVVMLAIAEDLNRACAANLWQARPSARVACRAAAPIRFADGVAAPNSGRVCAGYFSLRKTSAMSTRKRTVIAIIVIELLLAGGWLWMHSAAATSSRASSDSTRVIGEVFGGAMGLILGLAPVLYLMARRNDRRANNPAPRR